MVLVLENRSQEEGYCLAHQRTPAVGTHEDASGLLEEEMKGTQPQETVGTDDFGIHGLGVRERNKGRRFLTENSSGSGSPNISVAWLFISSFGYAFFTST